MNFDDHCTFSWHSGFGHAKAQCIQCNTLPSPVKKAIDQIQQLDKITQSSFESFSRSCPPDSEACISSWYKEDQPIIVEAKE